MPDYDLPKVSQLLGISVYDFSSENLGSPFPNYHKKVCFANIEVHFSTTHSNALINLSGQACRQYEEYMNKGEGWQWQKFLKTIIELNGKITRIDLALDIFDDLSPSVKTIQDYIKRGQLSTKAHKFVEINSGRISDGVLTGFTIYIGSAPQILRIYDKANERLVNADEIIIGKWIRWELELTDKKAQQVAVLIGEGKPLGYVIRGILAAHYSFKTQNKKIEIHNKSRLPKKEHKTTRELQVDNYYRSISGEKIENLFFKWMDLIADTDRIGKLKKDELRNMIKELMMYGSPRTVYIGALFQQYNYKRPSTSKDFNAFELLYLGASLVASMKKDFTGYDVDPEILLRMKITDIDSDQNRERFRIAKENANKIIKDGII